MSAVLFGDVEDSVITWLQGGGLDAPIVDRVTKPRSGKFVVVERLGGPALSVAHEQATVTIEAWAPDYRTAHNLAQKARQRIHNLPGQVILGNGFSRVDEFAGPGRLPDPVSAIPRFVFTVSLTVRPV